jgi:4-alpha-glucanotransferase
MTLTFQLRYHTRPGQSLWLSGNHPLLGNEDPGRAVPLEYLDAEFWRVTFNFASGEVPDTEIVYDYVLREADGSMTRDLGRDRAIVPAAFEADDVRVIDSWNDPGFIENAFYTEPFRNVLLTPNQTRVSAPGPASPTHRFKVKAPLLAKDQTLCLLGNRAALGDWNTTAPLLLNRAPEAEFLWAELDLGNEAFPLEYKYGVFDAGRGSFVRWEDGPNRVLREPAAPGRLVISNDGFARLPNDTWRGAGVAIPVFSLRSERSFGVGEFSDLKLLADWCARVGLKVVQLLPVNDTTATHTWTDSYPYAAISAFALHPQYLDLGRVGVSGRTRACSAAGSGARLPREWEVERQRLNALPSVDYEAVMRAKRCFLKRIFPSLKRATFRSRRYRQFFAENRHWLLPYAAFCHLRDRFGTADFSQWPKLAEFNADEVAALAAEGSEAHDEIAFHCFVQFHLDAQLRDASAYAHERGVILKGDIAIGVSRHGADTWQQPELFQLDQQAGAPPDAFAAKGQNWGFPTYNWPRMQATGYAWWKQRFAHMGRYFDAFRVDHILGFFRIWSIPLHAVEGILGRFVPALPVERGEFAARGVAFDHGRYVKPFITEEILRATFGPEAGAAQRRFLLPTGNGHCSLKPEFATQRQVERHFAALQPTKQNQRLKRGLFDLLSNVILIEDDTAPGEQFHFRFDVANTSSFQALAEPAQVKLRELYVDYYYRRQEDFWRRNAIRKLPALQRVTNMLICGEDLGVVPACVPETMRRLGLLSLEVQRMPKVPGQEFFRPAQSPYLAVVTPGTHDMSTLRGWWREDRAVTQKFFNTELGQPGEAPAECDPELVGDIIRQHLASPAMWSIFPLQDLLGLDERLRHANPDAERINVPAIPNYRWCYRMPLTLEQLLHAETFNERLARWVRDHAR